jgi:hypothetical protein
MTQPMDETSYTYGEAMTGHNQVVRFKAPSGRREAVEAFFRENIAHIELPEEQPVPKGRTSHGAYGHYSRYEIRQHGYAGGGYPGNGGFIEVLEIKNPPDGRCGVVIYEESSPPQRCSFSEWESVEQAEAAYEKVWTSREERRQEIYRQSPGFIRTVPCGYLTPWFYAVGEQELSGDYAIVPGWHNDHVYRLGGQYVVYDANGVATVKTCMGSRVFQKKSEHYPHNPQKVRVIQWEDGSYWSSDAGCYGTARPRPVEASEAWIADAAEQFRELLSGHRKSISVEFTNGMRFTGSFRQLRKQRHAREGRYYAIVHLKDEAAREGWVNFKPTQTHPDVVTYIRQKLDKPDLIERISIERYHAPGKRRSYKLWAGVFYKPPKDA